MNALKHIGAYLLGCTFVVAFQPLKGVAQENSGAAKVKPQETAAQQGGQHDFDFEIGTWKTHQSRRLHPLTGSNTWIEFDGTSVVRRVWNGRGDLLELESDAPAGHSEGLILRLYNPQTRQWSSSFGGSSDGALSQPTIGEFKNGRGEFYDLETFNGRTILARSVLSDITQTSYRLEQAFSDDGGKTWEVNWISLHARVKGESGAQQNSNASTPSIQQTPTKRDGQHDFDFEIGAWKTHLRRLVHPLTNSNSWVEYDGTTGVSRIWNGKANLVELEADGPGGHFQGLNLRLYNPQSHQWSLNFANSNDGTLTQPTIGEFKNGRGEFFDQETFNGRAVFVRFVISDITSNSCRFEQSFSDDGGKTWEVNWIAIDTRLKDEPDKAH
jgi:hypothetical protein